jgi:aspartyl-tRNA(Asn)/glutamyl-tRNA(Gln) amidotransferase subunit B
MTTDFTNNNSKFPPRNEVTNACSEGEKSNVKGERFLRSEKPAKSTDFSPFSLNVGLEIHAELNTESKIFCSCKNEFTEQPNSHVCPVCMGLPGALPVLNRAAVEKTIQAGLAFGCKINEITIYDRKNYFYPDLPKAYQISQMFRPICVGGGVKLQNGKFIRLNRIHSEEDAGKLLHDDVNEITLVDYNRCGVPLIEMVTEPDFSTADEVVEFLEEVRSRLIYTGVANCKMEEGGMRCDVNISLRPAGSEKLGNRVELKNLNSWKMVARAIEYEVKRQTALLNSGKSITIETRKWNDAKCATASMRNKESGVDYRYFPDPDQYPVHIPPETVERIKASMPKLADEYRAEFTGKLGLPAYDADILTRDKKLTQFYIDCLNITKESSPKEISNWILTNVLAKVQNYNILITPKQLCDIIAINKKEMIDEVWGKPDAVIKAPVKIARDELVKIIDGIFNANPNAVTDFKITPDKIINFFMGQTMKATKGLADSIVAKEIITTRLKNL